MTARECAYCGEPADFRCAWDREGSRPFKVTNKLCETDARILAEIPSAPDFEIIERLNE